jgi:hypothetical protein
LLYKQIHDGFLVYLYNINRDRPEYIHVSLFVILL